MQQADFILEAKKYIEKNLDTSISVHSISEYTGYSEYHFSRLFHEATGMSVMEYVRHRRLLRASEAILNGQKVIDAAMAWGWESHSGFIKAFKKEFGFCPSLLRAMIISFKESGGNAMEHLFLKEQKLHADKEELFCILIENLLENKIDFHQQELYQTYQYACEVYSGVKRYSGDEYITHPLNVAILLAEMNAEIETIQAGLFCDAIKKHLVSEERIRKILKPGIAELIIKSNHADLNSTYIDDTILLIKLAERLHNMRTIEAIDKKKQQEKVTETYKVFLPIANKLGNKKLTDELNDLILKYS